MLEVRRHASIAIMTGSWREKNKGRARARRSRPLPRLDWQCHCRPHGVFSVPDLHRRILHHLEQRSNMFRTSQRLVALHVEVTSAAAKFETSWTRSVRCDAGTKSCARPAVPLADVDDLFRIGRDDDSVEQRRSSDSLGKRGRSWAIRRCREALCGPGGWKQAGRG